MRLTHTCCVLAALFSIFANSSIHAAELTDEERDALNKGEISTAQTVAGGLVATLLLPFGVGQAIEGRYLDTGWIFTTGELASIGVLVAGAANSKCTTTVDYSGSFYSHTTCNTNSLFWVGLGGLVGFRLWEIIDSWVGPAMHNRTYYRAREKAREGKQEQKTSLFLAPVDSRSMTLGLQFRF